ncbi:MAG: hypothetical protein KAG84_03520 [Bacteroidales bacterium]|nr:hypothetical protein [Bacteroidales bacterium]
MAAKVVICLIRCNVILPFSFINYCVNFYFFMSNKNICNYHVIRCK